MPVVADTSPLNYLVLIGEIDVLPKLYRRIVIPSLVLGELGHPEAPPTVIDWARLLPDWVDIDDSLGAGIDPELARLDLGEAAAITVAQASEGSLLDR